MVVIMTSTELQNLCPVCGYDMDDPPRDYNICPSCGTEFGLHDLNASVLELREAWIKTGPKWWSATDAQPVGWDPYLQLARLGICGAVTARTGVIQIQSTTVSHISLSSGTLEWPVAPWGQFEGKQLSLGLPSQSVGH
jgi:hypothetical protein